MAGSITASVGANGANRPADARVIQQMLNAVPPAGGGPVPALAVDGICGPLTSRAISAFQTRQFGWADGLVEPGKVTIRRLNDFSPPSTAEGECRLCGFYPKGINVGGGSVGFMLGFALSAGQTGPAAAPQTPREAWLANTPAAGTWVDRGLGVIDAVLMRLPPRVTPDLSQLGGVEEFKIMQAHFHLSLQDRHSLMQDVHLLKHRFQKMRQTITNMDVVLRESARHPDGSIPFGYVLPLQANNPPSFDGKIYVTPSYLRLGPVRRVYVVVHETAHFIDPPIEFQGNNPIGIFDTFHETVDQEAYDGNQTPAKAMRNAFAYSQFALHAFFRQDRRVDPITD